MCLSLCIFFRKSNVSNVKATIILNNAFLSFSILTTHTSAIESWVYMLQLTVKFVISDHENIDRQIQNLHVPNTNSVGRMGVSGGRTGPCQHLSCLELY